MLEGDPRPHIYRLDGRWKVSKRGWRDRGEKLMRAWDLGFDDPQEAFAWAAKPIAEEEEGPYYRRLAEGAR